MRFAAIVVAALAVCWIHAEASSTDQSAPNPQFRVRTDLVTVPVSVTRGRNPVTGLTAADFELTDNGIPQLIDALSLEYVPIDVTFLLTEFPADRDREFQRILEAAGQTRGGLSKDDRLQLVLVDDRITAKYVDVGASLAVLPEVRNLQTGRGFAGGVHLTRGQGDRGPGWGIALADGLLYALAFPTGPDRRHVIIAFTDGHSTASVLDMSAIPGIASRSDAVLHAVLWATPQEGGNSGGINIIGTVPPNRRDWLASYRALDEAVQRTGGTLQRLRNADDALTEILANFRSSYVLRYTPVEAPKPGWHEIKVKVTRPGSYNIRARRGYEVGR